MTEEPESFLNWYEKLMKEIEAKKKEKENEKVSK